MERIKKINASLAQLFGGHDDPFKIMTRLAEECGELAAQINHFEDAGVKRQKHGEPDKMKLAKEVQDVIRCALQIAAYYDIEAELEASIESSFQKLQAEGLIVKCPPFPKRKITTLQNVVDYALRTTHYALRLTPTQPVRRLGWGFWPD